jgi:4a-hydroxytetrahydrobiopterin dehydratase
MAFAEPLTDDEIERRLSELDGWTRAGDEISKTFGRTYHECVHLAMYVAAKAREVGHHPDIDIRWQREQPRQDPALGGGPIREHLAYA